ncbi:MAG: 30S ribosomal protein S16 [Candidatus Omnitrophica bacterium]|nr:30S ribosomal protein S16 [Candidatus Omnitrophota bacterium]
MAVVLRLKRMGANKKPFYRIVATEKTRSRDGRFIEEIGYYDPKKNPAVVNIDKERALYWLKNGATPSVTVKSLMKRQGIKK